MGLPMEYDLLATTSEQIMEQESKFDTQKNLLSLTFQSINIVIIDHVKYHMTIFLKILKFTKLVEGLRKEVKQYQFSIQINKFLSLQVSNDSPLHFNHFTPYGRYELNKLTSLPMCGFIAQLVEQRTGNVEVTGSNPVEALVFSGFFCPIA